MEEYNHGDVFSYPNSGTFTLCELPVSNLWVLISNANGSYWGRPGADPEDAFGDARRYFKREKNAKPRPKHFLLFSFPEGTIAGIESVFKGSTDCLSKAMDYDDGGMVQVVCRDTLAVIFCPTVLSKEEFMLSLGRQKTISEDAIVTCSLGEN